MGDHTSQSCLGTGSNLLPHGNSGAFDWHFIGVIKMKLVTFIHDGRERLGAMKDELVLDLASAEFSYSGKDDPVFASMLALIEGGPAALDRSRLLIDIAQQEAWLQPEEYTLCAPLPVPVQMRDVMCFEKHLEQAIEGMTALRAEMAGADPHAAVEEARVAGLLKVPQIFYDQPIYYKANRLALCGTDQDVVWPDYSSYMDYECELACIIGRKGKDISKERAKEHIFGFTIFNDLSARDAQCREIQGYLGPAKGKDFDKANVMGPCIITLDEIGDSLDLEMIVRVNGVEMSRGSSSTMYWSFEDVIAWVSQAETIYPGEILGSGTVGDGCGLEHFRFLKHGDVIELEVEKIGVLRTRVLRNQEA